MSAADQPCGPAVQREPDAALSASPDPSQSLEQALLALGHALLREHYRFVAVTPVTHARVAGRRARASDLRDVFGWNLAFEADLLPAEMMEAMQQANALGRTNAGLQTSGVRFASWRDTLLVHSAWPALDRDAVRFGPDGYRYAALIERTFEQTTDVPRNAVELCCNAGIGGLVCARLFGDRTLVLFADTSLRALRHARVNALLADIRRFDCQHSKLLATIRGAIDLIVANAPHGELAQQIVAESLDRLTPGGRLVLCAPAPITDGYDPLREAIEPMLRKAGARHRYDEIEADLPIATSEGIERVAAVGLVAQVR